MIALRSPPRFLPQAALQVLTFVAGVASASSCGQPVCDLDRVVPGVRVELPFETPLPYRAAVTTGPGRFELARPIDEQGREESGLTLQRTDDAVRELDFECRRGEANAVSCDESGFWLREYPAGLSAEVTKLVEPEAVWLKRVSAPVVYDFGRTGGDDAECPTNTVDGIARLQVNVDDAPDCGVFTTPDSCVAYAPRCMDISGCSGSCDDSERVFVACVENATACGASIYAHDGDGACWEFPGCVAPLGWTTDGCATTPQDQ